MFVSEIILLIKINECVIRKVNIVTKNNKYIHYNKYFLYFYL